MKLSLADAKFLHSPAWRALPPRERVERYLGALGVDDVDSWEKAKKVVARLKRRHRNEWQELQDVFQRRGDGDDSDDLYSAKNVTLELSLGIGAIYSARVHRAFLQRFVPRSPAPATILDVGCENGLLACYYALMFPEAVVEGIDPCSKAIERAQELATVLGITNATFLISGLDHLTTFATGRVFDLVVATTVFQDCGLFPDPDDERAKAELASPRPVSALVELQSLRQILNPNGEWISLERCRYPSDLGWWLETTMASGWSIDWARSERVDCADGPEPNDLTLAFFQPATAPTPLDPERVRALWLSARFARGEESRDSGAWIFSDTAARACFEFVNPKSLLHGAKASACGFWETREVWTAGPFAFLYRENRAGASFLRWSVLTKLPSLIAEWERDVKELEGYMGKDEMQCYGPETVAKD